MVTVELKRETEEGEDLTITVEAEVTRELDPYGTGDSPTSYEVFIASCYDNLGNAVELTAYEDQEAEKLLIEEVRS